MEGSIGKDFGNDKTSFLTLKREGRVTKKEHRICSEIQIRVLPLGETHDLLESSFLPLHNGENATSRDCQRMQ